MFVILSIWICTKRVGIMCLTRIQRRESVFCTGWGRGTRSNLETWRGRQEWGLHRPRGSHECVDSSFPWTRGHFRPRFNHACHLTTVRGTSAVLNQNMSLFVLKGEEVIIRKLLSKKTAAINVLGIKEKTTKEGRTTTAGIVRSAYPEE